MELFTKPSFHILLDKLSYKNGKELYDSQVGHLASSILVEDYNPATPIDTSSFATQYRLKFPDGALISGSFIMHHVAMVLNGTNLAYDDIDIYFPTKDSALKFLSLNQISLYNFSDFNNPMCAYGFYDGLKLNLIYGVPYSDPASLISRFDIRACSMAVDPNANILYVVRGAIEDATRKNLVFNSVPRGVSLRRFTKYIQKGFEADKYQNLFFVELLRSDLYSAELELMTKEY